MSKYLLIVESPAKAKTINQYLGSDYVVKASFGHVRDLPSKELGVDVKNDFAPNYVISPKSKKIISELKKALSDKEKLILATDLDREGEAIAWHLVEALKPKQPVSRITFSEITKSALNDAIKHGREIDFDLVDAQQARRILDRLVGYKLSPFLWKKVYAGLSAGRVQSVALRLIIEREDEIDNFKPEPYWNLKAAFLTKKNEEYEGILTKVDGKNLTRIPTINDAKKYFQNIQKADFYILDIIEDKKNKTPLAPFTTSTLQQEASRKLYISVKQTMRIAQDLYEGVEINGKTQALITYMRTDAVTISEGAIKQAREVIEREYGKKYIPNQAKVYTTKSKRAQEAHEAIRPIDFNIKPSEIKNQLDNKHYKLYDLIWKRALASQMEAARINYITLETASKTKEVYTFATKGQIILFDGFLKVYEEGRDEVQENVQILPEVEKNEAVDLKKADIEAKTTQPPARFTEAMLVKELEKRDIGRPSTYAPIISTILERNYITKEGKQLIPTEVGKIVTNLLKEHFTKIVDYDFTANMEDKLDDIAEGKEKWQKLIKDFYNPFISLLAEKQKTVEKVDSSEKLDEKCPNCGESLQKKLGRFGQFIACSNFPTCKYTRPLAENNNSEVKKQDNLSGKKCPKCKKGELNLKESRYGTFWACSKYPECKYTESVTVEAPVSCPNDNGKLIQKRTKRGRIFWGCANYPKCKTAFWGEPQAEKCPKCKNILIKENNKIKCSQCDYKEGSKE